VGEIAPVEVAGKPISSTRIRNAIAIGNFNEAAICLGREFLLCGIVVTGAGLGAKIGFPTANLMVSDMQIPPDGVYAVKVDEGKRRFSGVANIGMRPTLNPSDAKRTVEVHLFDLSENLVGKELCIEFLQFLRSELKFPDLAALAIQIAKDCRKAQESFLRNVSKLSQKTSCLLESSPLD
jgi:riboflavin kinase/FMN adenylyltransferase